jgi:hypothetical protein
MRCLNFDPERLITLTLISTVLQNLPSGSVPRWLRGFAAVCACLIPIPATSAPIPLSFSDQFLLHVGLQATEGPVSVQLLQATVPFGPDGSATITSSSLTADVSFSLASQAAPFIFDATLGASAVPVALNINSVGLEVPRDSTGGITVPYGISGHPESVSSLIPVSGSIEFNSESLNFSFDVINNRTGCGTSIPNLCWDSGVQFDATSETLLIENFDTVSTSLGGFNPLIGTIDGVEFQMIGFGISVSSIGFGVVPEPSTALLLGLGLTALAVRRGE